MPAKVLGQLADGRVTFRRILLECLADDRIEIPFEKPVQTVRGGRAVGRKGREIPCRNLACDNAGRRRGRVGFDDGLEQVGRRGQLAPRMLSRQQDVQKQPQRVDVRRSRGRSSANLLGCGIGGCQSCALLERQCRDLDRLPVGFEQLGDTEVEQLQ
jgi:hypothetical protein